MKLLRLALVVAALITSAVVPAAMAQTNDTMSVTPWRLVSYGSPQAPIPVIGVNPITLELQPDGRFEGNGGCNGYSGTFTRAQNDISFSDVLSTRMACADNQVTQQETAYFDALQAATSYMLNGAQMTIWYGDGQQLNFTSDMTGTDMLQGTSWRLVNYGLLNAETPVIPDSSVTLSFTANGVEGNGGCNGYGGGYTIAGNRIAFDDVVSTLMACDDQQVTQQEQMFLTALQSATRYERFANLLTIWYDNGQRWLNFVPDPPVQMPPPACGATWTVQPGDTLTAIAEACSTTVSALLDVNPQIIDPNRLLVGWVLYIAVSDVAPVPPVDLPRPVTEVPPIDLPSPVTGVPPIDLPRPVTEVPPIDLPQPVLGQIGFEQTSAAPGTTINLVGSGFTPHTDLDIGFSVPNSDNYLTVGAARTTTDGSFRTTVTIPETADPNQQWVFTALSPYGRLSSPSPVFDVTGF